jgi:hypothetical protein
VARRRVDSTVEPLPSLRLMIVLTKLLNAAATVIQGASAIGEHSMFVEA